MNSDPIWKPSEARITQASVSAFIELVNKNLINSIESQSISTFHDLYQWSILYPEKFWSACWDFFQIKGSYTTVLSQNDSMSTASFFPDALINFAEHLLTKNDDSLAITFWGEAKIKRSLSWKDLNLEVRRIRSFLRSEGVAPGDVVAGLLPNAPEAVIAMLATTSLGAIWTSCSPDFGAAGIVDRFGQTKPKVLFTVDGYWYRDRVLPLKEKLEAILPELASLKSVVIINYAGGSDPITSTQLITWNSWTEIDNSPFEKFPFNHPLYILYSSGTTGKPKCIVHRSGGILLEHLKELVLHVDLKPTDTIFFQTTCGWMMWNWLVSSLAVGAHIVLYDGNPLQFSGKILFNLIDQVGITVFGTNAKFLSLIDKEGLKPEQTHSLATLHTILSTGSPLSPESFDYVYRDIKKDVCLSSISGGTDIVGCFALGSPTIPVYRGELQTRSLALNVQVWNEQGKQVPLNEKGELVCIAPFPSQPLYFWNDSDGTRYESAYFKRFPGVWHHGDFVTLTEHQGMIFYGRSDAVLNPGGVRIGTAEIYRQVESLTEISESICIGYERGADVEVILFVRMKDGVQLDDKLKATIKKNIRTNASPFHVPKDIFEVKDIPKTRSGKIAELVVRDTVQGKEILNGEALVNPECLDEYRVLGSQIKSQK